MATIRGTLSAVALAAAAMLVATGCTVQFGEDAEAAPAQAAIDLNPVFELIKPKVTSVVADGAVGHSPGDPVAVRVADGKLSKVTLLDASGDPVAGAIAPDGQSWVNTQPLKYNGEYRLEADAFGLGGASTTVSSFTTSSPGNLTKPYVMPGDGDVVGIGQPVAVQFDESIPDRKAAQDAITVVTNPPVPGAFYWVNDREVRWRPENYWAPGTAVTVDVNVFGRNLGGTLFGQANEHREFRIGDSMIAYADDNTKQVTFERNGQVVMTMPTSMGKDSSPTDNGVYIIGDRFEHLIMDSSTYGVPVNSPQGYKTPVDYATRMSYSGIFFHSAPWSVGDQGSANVSHGCLNLSPANARWVFENTKRGDLTIVKNTVGGTLSGTDGLGDWNIPWATWKAGNA